MRASEPSPGPPSPTSSAPPAVRPARPDRELPRWLVPVAAVVLLAAAALVVLVVRPWITDGLVDGKDLSTARLGVVSLVLAVFAGGGGALAIYLAVRRQRSTERDLRLREQDQQLRDRAQAHNEAVAAAQQAHQDRVAAATELDSARRAVTEQYSRAVDQLGSDNDTVRLGGLYALERLGQDVPEMRQTVANVLCAYLRRPFTPPPATSKSARRGGLPRVPAGPGPGSRAHRIVPRAVSTHGGGTGAHDPALELGVRLTAQHILRDHLRPGTSLPANQDALPTYWGTLVVDLAGAVLVDFDFSGVQPGHATFDDAIFVGGCRFQGAFFTGSSTFNNARFNSVARMGASFHVAAFAEAVFAADAHFIGATFRGEALFLHTTFAGVTRFVNVTFHGDARFDHATFALLPVLQMARVTQPLRVAHQVWPDGWQVRMMVGDAPAGMEAEQWGFLTYKPSPDQYVGREVWEVNLDAAVHALLAFGIPAGDAKYLPEGAPELKGLLTLPEVPLRAASTMPPRLFPDQVLVDEAAGVVWTVYYHADRDAEWPLAANTRAGMATALRHPLTPDRRELIRQLTARYARKP